MCFFPLPNNNIFGPAYKKGVTNFECGACPECLSKRANRAALRDVYEARSHAENCMCTLTYDSYLRDKNGKIIGEAPPDRELHVCKRDIQLFIKRLRVYVKRHYGADFKYRVSAEYGKRTHRAHYHLLLFGWRFPDCTYYKKSSRGNVIYKSALLTRLWNHGICTVDSVNISAKHACYCSKYTMKDHGAEDTFSLCSQHLGLDLLWKEFNGKSYMMEGTEMPIPRQIWERYITECYEGGPFTFSTRYVNRDHPDYYYYSRQRRKYQIIRDHDPLYREYLSYWSKIGRLIEAKKPPVIQRILQLKDSDYHFYKNQALDVLRRRQNCPAVAPRSNCSAAYDRWYLHIFRRLPGVVFDPVVRAENESCRIPSCQDTASDTLSVENRKKRLRLEDRREYSAAFWHFYHTKLKIFTCKTLTPFD